MKDHDRPAVLAGTRLSGADVSAADHGNAETMIDPVTKGPHTYHTTNPVPFVLVSREPYLGALRDGRLGDVAPTLLPLLDLPVPAAMTGANLLTPA